GVNWTNNTNWLTNDPVSNWYGVTVSSERVSQLNLSLNNLIGTIPPNFANLTALIELNLERNDLSGSFPPEILALVNLTSLIIRNNNFTGPIPNNIDVLSKLERLSLFNNPFSGHLPPEIGNLSNLINIRIAGTDIDGPIPPEFGNLINLTYLSLRQNDLSGNIPPELGNLTNLDDLELYGNELTGEIPPELGNLKLKGRLFLHANRLIGSIPAELGNLTSIDNLRLENNKFTGTIPIELGNLINLRILFLYGNQLSGSVPNEITNITGLEKFSINHNELTNLPDLSPLTSLTELYIQDNNFNFDDIEPNIGIATTFTYSPQDSIGVKLDTTIDRGSSIAFTISAGGNNTAHQWMKDGVEISGAEDSSFAIDSAKTTDTGTYVCKSTNTLATELTLFSKPFNLIVDEPFDIADDPSRLPDAYRLYQNYPNPFNPSTKIKYSIPIPSPSQGEGVREGLFVSLKVFDLLGREIATLVNEQQQSGYYEVDFKADKLTSGIYFYKLRAGVFLNTKKMTLLR
ncbi:MAG: T9SS type A sorting domain-containing protein, partial [Bacteroidota bacterium]